MWKEHQVDIFENILITHSYIQQKGIRDLQEASPALVSLDTRRNRTASALEDVITQPD